MLVKFNPFGLLNHNSFLDDFLSVRLPTPTRTFEPKIDVKESDKEFTVYAELPGLDKDDFKLTLENSILTLAGEKKFEHEEKKGEVYRVGRSYGSFKRSFRLNDTVDSKKIKADYKNGILAITIPKTEKTKPKEIEIAVK